LLKFNPKTGNYEKCHVEFKNLRHDEIYFLFFLDKGQIKKFGNKSIQEFNLGDFKYGKLIKN